jgi:hypothetical protein
MCSFRFFSTQLEHTGPFDISGELGGMNFPLELLSTALLSHTHMKQA